MIDIEEYEKVFREYPVSDYWPQMKRIQAHGIRSLSEIKRLRKEINQLPIDLHESLDMILEAHHPEVRESVMSMFGDAWGNNLTGYEE
jgi:DNA integrity scanning protein DisA with diadenylate cyclase activity